jgi:outer membrane biosynthesis protein TonB
MLKIFKYLNFTDADVAKFDNETMQMAALIEGFQSVYSTTPDTSAKKNALAATIAESIRILLKRIYSVQGLDPRVKENIKDEMAKLPNAEEPKQQQQPKQTKPQQPEPKQPKQQKEEPKQQTQSKKEEPQKEPTKIKIGDLFYHKTDENLIYKLERIERGTVVLSWYKYNVYSEVNMGYTLDTMQKLVDEGTYILVNKKEEPKQQQQQEPEPEPKQQQPQQEPQQQQPEPKPKKQRAKKQKPSQEPEEVDFTESELQEAIDGLELLEDMSEDIQNELARLREKIKNIQSKI